MVHIHPFVAGIKPGRPQVWTRRQLTDGIQWRTRTGAPWRDVPERYGPWDRVYDLFRRWQRDRTWARILTQLRGGRQGPDHLGRERRLHRLPGPPARRRSGEKGDLQKEPPGGVFVQPADHALGRSRGGLTSKIHLAVEQGQKPLSARGRSVASGAAAWTAAPPRSVLTGPAASPGATGPVG
ncbi:transposase [Streptomyces bobili]|uniref:transposase n=1 Tax=Streptomyces bobili TaxID=67280 RepID=UPI0037023CDB